MMIRAGEQGGGMGVFRRGARHGVKEELSELTGTLGRLFLAPAPPPTHPPCSPPRGLVGIRNDLAEIGGSFRTGISALSNLLRCSPEKGDQRDGAAAASGGSRVSGAVGVTEEILEFVGVLAGRPEEWLQCPVPLDGVSDLSETQRGHIKMTEHLVPSLAALRVSLCPSRLSEGSFWTIYFFLLHPRLSKCDSELLSTTQIVEEMDRGLQELRNRIIARLESYKASVPYPTGSDKRSVIQDADNQVQEEVSSNTETTSSSWVNAVEQDNIDQWLEEDGVLLIPADGRKPLGSEEDGVLLIPTDGRKQLGSETDVSFSDLEYDDSHVILKRPTSSSSLEVAADSSACSSSEWVPLKYRSGSQYRGNKKPVPSTFEQEAVDGESSDWVSANDSD